MLSSSAREAVQLLCQRHRLLLLAFDSQQLTLASLQQPSDALLSELRFACGRQVTIELWPAAQLEQALTPLEKIDTTTATVSPESINELEAGPAAEWINQLLRLARQRRASDIHLEPFHEQLRVRLRVDGVLQVVMSPPTSLAAAVVARLKILAQLNIAERRLPQDGLLRLTLDGDSHALRIATLPSLYGEKVALRLLPADRQEHQLSELGMPDAVLAAYRHALHHPQGLILVTGPTGSGKTVTLYSGLALLNQPQRHLCTLEDPIEIPVEGINQIPINAQRELGFAQVLRALLRQDPDVIMIGEIRDQETAAIAVNAAQTGHLVLSTLHTNSTTETLSRLSNMGLASYLLASSLKLIIAQRLVRCLCPHCREPLSSPVILPSHISPAPLQQWHARGCERCFAGYYGRTGLYEVLPINAALQQALVDNVPPLQLAQIAREQGLEDLFRAGLTLVSAGITSLEELYRVVGTTIEPD